MSGNVPQLLVSVRDTHEALAALRGGADIIDVKEPASGSLGRASVDVISGITDAMLPWSSDQLPAIPLSLALGEVNEWLDSGTASQIADVPTVIRRAQPHFLKLGLAGLCADITDRVTWFDSWMQVRDRFPGGHAWVAVAYADAVRARAPSVAEVCEAAVKSRCRVLLVDTFEKDESTLLDWLTGDELGRLRCMTTDRRLLFALAGRISAATLPRLAEFEPDIVAVRGAVCDRGVRTSTISEGRVRAFRDALQLTKSQ